MGLNVVKKKFIHKNNVDRDIMEIENGIEIGNKKSIIKYLKKDNEDIGSKSLKLSEYNANYKTQIKFLIGENKYLKNNNTKSLSSSENNFQISINNNMMANKLFTKTAVSNNNQLNSVSKVFNEKEGESVVKEAIVN